jgi:serine/threonine protein kinase
MAPEPRAAPAVGYAEMLADAEVDPRLATGPFSTSVWAGRYQVDGVLGGGSQGVAFVGTDLKTGVPVVLKLFDLGKARDWKAAELFDREAAALRQLNHSRMPQLLDVVTHTDSGARALVMTRLSGQSLAGRTAMDEARLWSTAVDVADVLDVVHRQGLVHRDIKPANLIEGPDGRIGVVDFGGVGHSRATAGSTVVGTFGFMAPEQLYGAQSPATDVYALGATLLSLATGQQPEDLPRTGLAIDVDTSAPWLSPSLRALLRQLTMPQPQDRPADGAAVRKQLAAIARGSLPAHRASTLPATSGPMWITVIGALLGVLSTSAPGRVLVPIITGVLSLLLPEAELDRLDALRVRSADTTTRVRAAIDEQRQQQRGTRKERRAARNEQERSWRRTLSSHRRDMKGKTKVEALWPEHDRHDS